ncbi:hypothetical protein, partial [Faecalibaculum rodentium]|uniref:hypothetical protein n=1 Tax=Faecalibaculum rodentium TaxID=1702221 RepID=UPI0025A945D5
CRSFLSPCFQGVASRSASLQKPAAFPLAMTGVLDIVAVVRTQCKSPDTFWNSVYKRRLLPPVRHPAKKA